MKNNKVQDVIAIILLSMSLGCFTIGKSGESSVWWLIAGAVILIVAIILLIAWSKSKK